MPCSGGSALHGVNPNKKKHFWIFVGSTGRANHNILIGVLDLLRTTPFFVRRQGIRNFFEKSKDWGESIKYKTFFFFLKEVWDISILLFFVQWNNIYGVICLWCTIMKSIYTNLFLDQICKIIVVFNGHILYFKDKLSGLRQFLAT